MIRRWSDNVFAAYTGGDMWGGRMLGLCESRSEAQSLVDLAFDGHLIGESSSRNTRTSPCGETLSTGTGCARPERLTAQTAGRLDPDE